MSVSPMDGVSAGAVVRVADEGTELPFRRKINFVGAGVSAAVNGEAIDVTIAGGGGAGDVTGDDTSTTVQNIVAYSTTGGKNITELTGTQGDVLYHNGTNWAKLAAGTSGHFLKTQGAGANPAWASASSSGIAWVTKTTTYTAVNGDFINVDVSGGSFTITLPASPSANDFIVFKTGASCSPTKKLTLGRNGNKIMNLSENMEVTTPNVGFTIVYHATTGWML